MKRLILLIALCVVATSLMAQTAVQDTTVAEPKASIQGTILDTIYSHIDADSAHLVTFTQDPRIMQLVNRKYSTSVTIAHKSKVFLRGCRVQVFSSNDPKQGKVQAQQMAARMRTAFPEVNVYLTYMAPFWKVRMGNFIDRETANQLANSIRRAYPSLRGDIYIVPDNVR